MEEKISLLELQERIRRGIEGAVPHQVWITAEIGEIKNHPSGEPDARFTIRHTTTGIMKIPEITEPIVALRRRKFFA